MSGKRIQDVLARCGTVEKEGDTGIRYAQVRCEEQFQSLSIIYSAMKIYDLVREVLEE